MRRDREIDLLPSKVVGRRREGAATLRTADALLRTAWALRGASGLAPRGLYRFRSFEEAQEWLRSQMSRRSGLRPSTTSDESAAPSTIRPSDAADRAWLEALGSEDG